MCYTVWPSSRFPSSNISSLSQYSYMALIRSRTDGHLKRLSVASTRKIVSYQDSANHATVATDDKWPRRVPLLVDTLPWQPALRGFFCFSYCHWYQMMSKFNGGSGNSTRGPSKVLNAIRTPFSLCTQFCKDAIFLSCSSFPCTK
jgi:hypothetical protein